MTTQRHSWMPDPTVPEPWEPSDHAYMVPATAAELEECLTSWEWRMFSGQLYQIMIKDEDAAGGSVVRPFRPNRAQRRFLARLHHRNLILKARQLGFTTLSCILFLDHALFFPDQRCGIIAHTDTDAKNIFRDKVLFAYNRLPAPLKAKFWLSTKNKSELVFGHNNSSIRVGTSMRSATINRLHVSELGKLARVAPQRAVEVVTGALPALTTNGIGIIESTAEGAEGVFYEYSTMAQAISERVSSVGGRGLAKSEWSFNFEPWWGEPEYTADPRTAVISATEHEYFDGIEVEFDTIITLGQRAWYILTRDNALGGDVEMMWREFPSTPEEAFQRSKEGLFLGSQMALARAEGRISIAKPVSHVPIHTCWDIGANDGTGIWSIQIVGAQTRVLRYDEGWGLPYVHFVNTLRDRGHVYGQMILPHDAQQKRQRANTIGAPIDDLRELAPDWDWIVAPRVHSFMDGIRTLRTFMGECYFDEEGCKAGLAHLDAYRKKWNRSLGVFTDEPEKHDGHSEAPDALRQFPQGFDALAGASRLPPRRNKSGMVA